jgi:hypothetical protein
VNAIAAHRRGELDDASAVTVISQETFATPTAYRTTDPDLVGREHTGQVLVVSWVVDIWLLFIALPSLLLLILGQRAQKPPAQRP